MMHIVAKAVVEMKDLARRENRVKLTVHKLSTPKGSRTPGTPAAAKLLGWQTRMKKKLAEIEKEEGVVRAKDDSMIPTQPKDMPMMKLPSSVVARQSLWEEGEPQRVVEERKSEAEKLVENLDDETIKEAIDVIMEEIEASSSESPLKLPETLCTQNKKKMKIGKLPATCDTQGTEDGERTKKRKHKQRKVSMKRKKQKKIARKADTGAGMKNFMELTQEREKEGEITLGGDESTDTEELEETNPLFMGEYVVKGVRSVKDIIQDFAGSSKDAQSSVPNVDVQDKQQQETEESKRTDKKILDAKMLIREKIFATMQSMDREAYVENLRTDNEVMIFVDYLVWNKISREVRKNNIGAFYDMKGDEKTIEKLTTLAYCAKFAGEYATAVADGSIEKMYRALETRLGKKMDVELRTHVEIAYVAGGNMKNVHSQMLLLADQCWYIHKVPLKNQKMIKPTTTVDAQGNIAEDWVNVQFGGLSLKFRQEPRVTTLIADLKHLNRGALLALRAGERCERTEDKVRLIHLQISAPGSSTEILRAKSNAMGKIAKENDALKQRALWNQDIHQKKMNTKGKTGKQGNSTDVIRELAKDFEKQYSSSIREGNTDLRNVTLQPQVDVSQKQEWKAHGWQEWKTSDWAKSKESTGKSDGKEKGKSQKGAKKGKKADEQNEWQSNWQKAQKSTKGKADSAKQSKDSGEGNDWQTSRSSWQPYSQGSYSGNSWW